MGVLSAIFAFGALFLLLYKEECYGYYYPQNRPHLGYPYHRPNSTGYNYTNSTHHYGQHYGNSTNATGYYHPIYRYHGYNSTYLPYQRFGNSTNATGYYPNRRYKRFFGFYYPAYYNYSGHNIFVGYPGFMDRLLYSQVIEKTPRWWSTREKIVEYPGYVPYGHIRNETITAIRVYDQGYHGNDGYARIIAGGIGYSFVKIKLYTIHWNKGFRFLVQIYGH